MALSAYALRTVAATKNALGTIAGSAIDALIEECVNQASEMVERAWGRHIVSRGALTEYHAKDPGRYPLDHQLYLNEWPVVSVTSVHEDPNRAYGASTLLTVTTDYVVSKPAGKLLRVSNAVPIYWSNSWRAQKVIYVAGYEDTAGSPAAAAPVPYSILRVFDELVGWMIQQRQAKELGLQSRSDAMGNRSFSGPAYITPGMQAALDAAGAMPASRRGVTGERDE